MHSRTHGWAVNFTCYAFLSTYGYDFQSVILIFLKQNTVVVTEVLYGWKKYLSSEVKSVELV